MKPPLAVTLPLLVVFLCAWSVGAGKLSSQTIPAAPAEASARVIHGWTVRVNPGFAEEDREVLANVLNLLETQLEEITRLVPAAALAELRKVPLWISPPYPDRATVAEYHPGAGWLRENGRDPAMAKGVEFSNIGRYFTESRRMPLLVLHELAHAYHDRVLEFDQPEILAAYQKAKDAGLYENVERRFGDPAKPPRRERAYAITNEKEYFAEATEAFFGVNDFFPFTKAELERHDPAMFRLVEKLWNSPPPAAARSDKPS